MAQDQALISMSSRLLTREIQLLTGRRAMNGCFFGYTPADATDSIVGMTEAFFGATATQLIVCGFYNTTA